MGKVLENSYILGGIVYSQASRRVEAVGLGMKGFERKTQRPSVGVGYWQMGGRI